MPYALLVIATLFIDFAANLPTGSLPLALARDGMSTATISAVLGVGMFAALFGSVPIGALADRFGRLRTIRVAGIVAVAALIALQYAHGVIGNGTLMALRTLALVAYMTAEFAYASDLVGEEHRVSAVATLGMVGNLSFAAAPAIGVWLWQHGVGREQYGYAAIAMAIGAAVLFFLPAKHDVPIAHRSRRIFMRSAWLPAIAFLVAMTIQSGVNASLAVLTFTHRGIPNGALLFTAVAGTTFALRYPAGRLVDRFGPRIVALPTALIQTGGCILASFASTTSAVLIAGIALGFAWAAIVPIGIALFFERSSTRTRGVAMGAYNFAFGIGSASGALLATAAAAFGGGYALAMMIAAIAPVVVLPYVFRSPAPARRPIMRIRGTTPVSD